VESPFCVIVDRFKRAIVIAIRGTLSVADALQDAYAAPEQLIVEWGKEALSPEFHNPSFMAHVGMLKGAAKIKAQLDSNNVLGELFGAERAGLHVAAVPVFLSFGSQLVLVVAAHTALCSTTSTQRLPSCGA